MFLCISQNPLYVILATSLLNVLKIDDPVGAFGVHWAAGTWAMIATGLFAEKIPGFGMAPEDGAFKGGNGHLLGINIAACLAISLWSGGCTFIIVSHLHKFLMVKLRKEF